MLSAMRLRELLSVTVDVFFVFVKLCHVTLLRIRTAKKITADKLTSCGQYIYCFTDAGISCYFSPMCFRSISLKIFFQAAVSVLRSIDVLNTLKSKRRWMKTLSLRTLPFFFTKIANFEAYAIINQKKRLFESVLNYLHCFHNLTIIFWKWCHLLFAYRALRDFRGLTLFKSNFAKKDGRITLADRLQRVSWQEGVYGCLGKKDLRWIT